MFKFCACLCALLTVISAEDDSLQVFRSGNNLFTSKLSTEVIKENVGKSFIISALSVIPPLAQLSMAAEGDSHDELLNAIGLPNDNVVKEVFPLLNNQLRSIKGVELKTASKIYIPTGMELNPNYEAVTREVFESEVANVDFTNSIVTAKQVNDWVEDQTNHRIKDLVDPKSLDASTRALLVNAIYFKGTWEDKFNKEATQDRDFHVSQSKNVKVPTMRRRGDFLYAESEELDAKLLEIFYEGREASFLVVLPNKIDGLSELEEKLKNPELLKNAIEKLRKLEVTVFLPKFKIETTTDLKKTLSSMGVKKIFTGEARLNKLLKGTSDLYVSDAIQKAFIEVNEEGAEAAAANEFGVSFASAIVQFKEYTFDADHPFAFFLKAGKNILFNGVFQN